MALLFWLNDNMICEDMQEKEIVEVMFVSIFSSSRLVQFVQTNEHKSKIYYI